MKSAVGACSNPACAAQSARALTSSPGSMLRVDQKPTSYSSTPSPSVVYLCTRRLGEQPSGMSEGSRHGVSKRAVAGGCAEELERDGRLMKRAMLPFMPESRTSPSPYSSA